MRGSSFRSSRPARNVKHPHIAREGSRKQHQHHPPQTFKQLNNQFTRVRGEKAIDVLHKCRRPINIITIGGNQLTGKSTLCNSLMIQLSQDHYDVALQHNKTPHNVAFLSAGQLFRQMAASRGLEVAQLSKEAQKNNDIDITIEYETCKGIMGGIRYTGRNVNGLLDLSLDEFGRAIKQDKQQQRQQQQQQNQNSESDDEIIDTLSDDEDTKLLQSLQKDTKAPPRRKKGPVFIPPLHPEHTVIIEGRNPGVMAAYCASQLQQANIFSIYLDCNPREQAVRYFKRDVDVELARTITSLLPHDKDYKTLQEVGKDIKEIFDNFKNTSALLPSIEQQQQQLQIIPQSLLDVMPKIETIIEKFTINQNRDDLDRQRYLDLYNFPPEMDYTSPTLYDLIVDTSDLQAPQLLQAVYDNLPPNFTQLSTMYENQKF